MPVSPRLAWQAWRWSAWSVSLLSTGSAYLPRALAPPAVRVTGIGDRKLLFRLAGTRRLRWLAGRVVPGDWDRSAAPVADHPALETFRRRFVEGAPWEETAYWRDVVRDVRNRVPRIGCRSETDVERKFQAFDRLWPVVGTGAYGTAGDLRSYRPWEEVLVGLGRGGELVLIDGRHRLLMAHLKRCALPMLLILRHPEARGRPEVRGGDRS